MYIDTHCHLNDEQLNIDLADNINNALANNVKKMIVVGWDKASSIDAIRLAHDYDFIYAAIGVHPSNIKEEDQNLSWISELGMDSKVIAIGEIGLDYHWDKDNKEDQKAWFIKQIEIAKSLNKPVIIHTRDAIEETYEVLKNQGYYNGVIHCYSGSFEMAEKFIKLGFYIGIGGVVTFKNSNLPDTIKKLGLDMIITETDSPYLAPTPHRGEMNKPEYIPLVIEKLSEVTMIDKLEVEKIIEENVKKLFSI